ncbi:MAG: L-fucose:H+ symporter permease [Verrucomicrobia bacterium A1]|nr:MAG: L-fucose:H+ symporter permease [Verrucomicrobia bacterium A1]
MWLLAVSLFAAGWGLAAEPVYDRIEDVIYARKYGTALTFDIFRPKGPTNGIGIVYAVSGGWYSSHDLNGAIVRMAPLLARGYTVFAVVHGSQPKFAIPEILEDMHRAVRFIRFHARDYGIDPDRIGITGVSAGGHLSLMQGTCGADGNPAAKDPIDRVSSRVQAVGCFCPPTDFLNYGKPGEDAIGRGVLANYAGAFDFRELDPKPRKLVPIVDEARIVELGRRVSPIYHVSASSAPALILHGDADLLVPIQQAETLVEKMKEAGVDAKLVVKPGAQHGWPDMDADPAAFTKLADHDLDIIIGPYAILGLVVLAVMVVFAIAKLPRSQHENHKELDILGTLKRLGGNAKYIEGVIAQAFYVGAQIMCWTFIIQYAEKELGMSKADGQWYNMIAMGIFVSSRFVCTYLLKFFSPGGLLPALAVGGVALVAGTIFIHGMTGLYCLVGVSACMSLMFPTIYGIALKGLGDDAKLGAAGLIMAIGGGCLMPPVQAWIMDQSAFNLGFMTLSSIRMSFVLPLVCFIAVAIFGFRTSNVHKHTY